MANKTTDNPFQNNPEKVLQERMKHARRITREEFIDPVRQKVAVKKPSEKK